MIDSPSVAPSNVTYVVPNSGFVSVADSCLGFQLKLPIGTLDEGTDTATKGDYIFQRGNKIYKQSMKRVAAQNGFMAVTSAGAVTTAVSVPLQAIPAPTVIKVLPISARAFISDIQLDKQNAGSTDFTHM